MTSLVMGIPIALLLLLLFFVLFVAPIQDQLSALATADQVNFGNWISHRGHGETKWLTWLPNSFKQDGSDLYLFEAKDLCRCSKQDSTGKYEKQQQHGDITLLFTFLHHSFVCTLIKGSGLDVMFLGGDPSRLLQMAIQQLFHHEQPFEVRKTPEDCDTLSSRPESPCGHLVMDSMNQTHCNGIKYIQFHSHPVYSVISCARFFNSYSGDLNIWSTNFERILKPMNITELLQKHLRIACGRKHNFVIILDIRRAGIEYLTQHQEIVSTLAEVKSHLKCPELLLFAHNAYETVNTGTSSHTGFNGDNEKDFVSRETLRKFHDNNIPFFNFHGIYQNFSDSIGIRNVYDVDTFKYLQSQILLNTICEIDPHQTMLFGSRVGSFQLKERKVFSEGQLVKASESKEIDLYKNGSLHMIPNWDTFLKLGFKMENVRNIPTADLEDMHIAKGDPLPPCTEC